MNGILARVLGQRSDSFHVSQSPPGWVERWAGLETASGVPVDETRALNLTAVFACVRILAETLSSLPLILYQRQADGGRTRATAHRLYSLLHDAPNPEMSSLELRETLTGHVALWGNGYAEIEYNRGGQVTSLWPLRPDKMGMKREGGELIYTYQLPKPDEMGRTSRKFAPWQIFHLRGWGFNGLIGYSPISLARQAIGLGLATEEFGARFFGNGARPGGVLEHPGHLDDEAYNRLKESWDQAHQGLSNAQRIAILEEGLSYKSVGIPPEEAQFLETRKFQVSEIARIFRIPPHMLADLDRATFSNIEHQSIEFVVYTMGPWFARWEQAIGRSLLSTAERAQYFAEFLATALLRGDTVSRYQAYAQGRQNGWLSANDIRRAENMDPVEGGDMYLVPLNMVPANSLAGLGRSAEDGPNARLAPGGPNTRLAPGGPNTRLAPGDLNARLAPGGPGAAARETEERSARSVQARHRLIEAYRPIYQDVAARVLRREANDVGAAARKFLSRRDYGQFAVWMDGFYGEEGHQAFVQRQFAPLSSSYGDLVAREAQDEIAEEETGLTPELERWIAAYLAQFAGRHCAISEGRIREVAEAAMRDGQDPMEAVTAELETWPEARAAETARWESVRFGNGLAVATFALLGRMTRRWVTISESCPYCRSLDGQIISSGQFFLSAGVGFQPEGAETPLITHTNIGHPPAHDGCDCMVAAG